MITIPYSQRFPWQVHAKGVISLYEPTQGDKDYEAYLESGTFDVAIHNELVIKVSKGYRDYWAKENARIKEERRIERYEKIEKGLLIMEAIQSFSRLDVSAERLAEFNLDLDEWFLYGEDDGDEMVWYYLKQTRVVLPNIIKIKRFLMDLKKHKRAFQVETLKKKRKQRAVKEYSAEYKFMKAVEKFEELDVSDERLRSWGATLGNQVAINGIVEQIDEIIPKVVSIERVLRQELRRYKWRESDFDF